MAAETNLHRPHVSSLRITDDQLIRLFRDNDDYQFELSAKGELIIMPPATPKSDERNAETG